MRTILKYLSEEDIYTLLSLILQKYVWKISKAGNDTGNKTGNRTTGVITSKSTKFTILEHYDGPKRVITGHQHCYVSAEYRSDGGAEHSDALNNSLINDLDY